jgi:DNA-binding transcriptional regulator LsrR (DeoR family)
MRSKAQEMFSVEERSHIRELIDICWWHYVDKKSLDTIAKLRNKGENRWKIARMIEEAEARNLIDPIPRFNFPPYIHLEKDLIDKFQTLSQAVVVPSSENHDLQRQLIARSAAEHLNSQIETKRYRKIGFTGGKWSFEVVSALPVKERGIDLYPLALFPRGPAIDHIDPLVIMTEVWNKSFRLPRIHMVTISPFAPNASLDQIRKKYTELSKHRQIQQMLSAIKNVDIAITGVGPGNPIKDQGSDAILIALVEGMGRRTQTLIRSKIVGDVGYCLINEAGITPPTLDFFLTVGTDVLRKMARPASNKQVIVFGGIDPDRRKTLRAALEGKLCNVVVTDENTAEELLKD